MEVVFALKRVLKLDDKRVFKQSLHDFKFWKYLFIATLLLKNEFFAHRFDGIELTIIFFASQIDFLSKSAFPNYFNLFKVLNVYLLVLISFKVLCKNCYEIITGLNFI